jgi:hypothetical protein
MPTVETDKTTGVLGLCLQVRVLGAGIHRQQRSSYQAQAELDNTEYRVILAKSTSTVPKQVGQVQYASTSKLHYYMHKFCNSLHCQEIEKCNM